jgi:DNA topoisomerase-1
MSKPLVIVESPAKAKTIAGFLGPDFVVESSIGHIRDLPRDAADVPASVKGEPWARLGVDVDNGFKPLYVVSRDKKDQVRKLKGLLKGASELYLATDEDREGESIAWHLLEVLSPPASVPVRRMVFHEITRAAIERAVADWRDLDRRLVDAQEARRILDRLYGYEVSPVLWKKVMPRLSAGRVQSVATRMLVERERARMRFRAGDWWDLEGTFAKRGDAAGTAFMATLSALDGRRLATGKDFEESGRLKEAADVVRLDEDQARGLAGRLAGVDATVRSVEERPYRRSPAAPFMTSTLQQEAGRKLGFSAQRAMRAAQSLYDNGYITYMRTDSTTLSETALAAARAHATELYGADYVPDQPRRYAKKVKNAQEAHEAIRPAGDSFRAPDAVASAVGADEARLYDLVWKRTIASQMKDAVGRTVTVRLGAVSAAGEDAEFATSGTVVTFPGFQRAYVEGSDDPGAEGTERERRLPPLAQGEELDVAGLEARGHTTQPPARFTEASLVKALEERGVGRPSTYASIIATIQDRGYVWKKGSALVPSFVAFAVVGLLERHFDRLVDYGFTATMEDDLDAIAGGQEEATPWLTRFYFGNGTPGLKRLVSEHLDEIDAREVNSIRIGTDAEGRDVVVRVGRYGPYLQRGDDRAPIPDDLTPDDLTLERAAELLEAPSGDRTIGPDPATGLPVLVRTGRYGPYVQLGEVDSSARKKPHTASLLTGMSPETVSLEDALRLLSLPRVVGVDPATGEEIVAQLGRYGPYLKKGSDSRSLESEEQLFAVTIEDALALYAQPKQRRGQRSAPPLRELGPDPATGAPVVIRDGRFGSYITDGEVNVTVPKGETVEGISLDRAAELLADKRAKGPTKSKRASGPRPAKTGSPGSKATPSRARAAKATKRGRSAS